MTSYSRSRFGARARRPLVLVAVFAMLCGACLPDNSTTVEAVPESAEPTSAVTEPTAAPGAPADQAALEAATDEQADAPTVEDSDDVATSQAATSEQTEEPATEPAEETAVVEVDQASPAVGDAMAELLGEAAGLPGLAFGSGGGFTVILDGTQFDAASPVCSTSETTVQIGGTGIYEGQEFAGSIIAIHEPGEAPIVTVGLIFGDNAQVDPFLYSITETDPGITEVTVDGSMVSGLGQMWDQNGRMIPAGASLPFSFSGSCDFWSVDVDDSPVDPASSEGTDYCTYAQEEVDRSNALSQNAAAAFDPQIFGAFWQEQLAALQAIEPPAEIADDFNVVRDAFFAATGPVEANGYDLLASIDIVSTTLGDSAVIDAGLRLADYNLQACGIEPAGGGGLFGG